MDNFMDKLAKRFNAGEIIKANAQAEARDMKRMQERTAEYERMMQEMRRLNLKNVEMSEQVQQLIQCGIEQFESYGTEEASVLSMKEDVAQVVSKSEEGFSDLNHKVEDNFSQLDGKLDRVGEELCGKVDDNQQAVVTALRELETRLEEQLKSDSGMDAAMERLETSMNAGRFTTDESLRQMNDMLLKMQASVGQMEENVRMTREILVATRVSVEEGNKRLEDHVHKENVRVYRNVQASIVEELTKRTRDINTRLDSMERETKKGGGLKPLVILTLLLALASVAMQVLQFLQLI